MERRASWFNVTSVTLGLAFLYLPILLVVIFSFNASRLVTVWGGFSTHWYASLLDNDALLDAAWVTLRVALLSASVATVLGTLAAIALVRYGSFRGRTLFSGMIYAPLVMPDVITGLSLLLLFVAVGIDRGFWTIVLAHVTLAIGYGGRQEVIEALRALLHERAGQGATLAEVAATITTDDIARHLYTAGQPDPDLVIRTSGEQRLSNFLLWQSAYSELYFCEAYWPAFREIDFLRALRSFAARQRRYGG